VKKFLAFILVIVSVASAQTITNLGNYPEGTKYSFQLTLNGTAGPLPGQGGMGRYIVYTVAQGNIDTSRFDQSWGFPGLNGTVNINFEFTVPPGTEWNVRWQYWIYTADDGGASASWNHGSSGPYTGTAGTGEPQAIRKVTVSLANTSGVPVSYKLMNGTTQVGSTVTLQPGQTLVQTFEIDAATASNLSVVAQLNDIDFSDGQWVVVPGAVKTSISVPAGGITNTNVHTDPTPTAPQVVPVPQPNAPASPPNGSGSGGTVWLNGGGTGTTDALTNRVFREGVDKITARQDLQTTELKKLGKQADSLDTLKNANPGQQNFADSGNAAKSDAESKFSGVPTPSEKSATKTQPDFTVTNGLLGSVDMNPFRSDRFGPIAEWFRSAFSWMLGILLAIRVGKEAAETVKSVTNAQQAKGNPVLAGTGAQATAFAAAAIVTALIIVGITAIVALAVSDFGFGTLTALFTANPYSGLPATVAWCLDQVMNLGHVTLYLFTVAVMPLLFAKINAATCAAVRFVVP